MNGKRYPAWLNTVAAMSLLFVAAGLISLIWSRYGALLVAIGFAGIWVVGTATERIDDHRKAKRR